VRPFRTATRASAAFVVAAWLLATPISRALARVQASTTQPVLHDLAAVSELQSSFDAAREKTRIVLLLSPT
jgi:hypothetical protein